MTENQTNQPAQPDKHDMKGEQRIPGSIPGPPKRRGRFASDGSSSRRNRSTPPEDASVVEQLAHATPPPHATRFGASENAPGNAPVVEQPTAHKRFEARTSEPTQPAQSPETIKPKHPVNVAPALPTRFPIDASFEKVRLIILAVIMVPLCIWASFPAWGRMVSEWYYTEDYSHGFLVVPATILFLFLRRETYPGTSYKLDWVGLFPIVIYVLFRFLAGYTYREFLDEVAILFWILSVVWFFYGWRVFLWALPSLGFLVFMFQLPWTVDVFMKHHLQAFATTFAAAMLTTIGETAIPIGNTIRLETMPLGVDEACSGLRILMAAFAIAFAAMLLLQRPWWQNILIFVIAAPLALFVNAVRITITGYLLIHYYESIAAWIAEGESVSVTADRWAGYVAIALTLGLFALFVWYLGKVFRRVEI